MVNGSIYVEALSAVQKQQVLEARQLPYQEVSERICSRLSPRRYNLLISYDLYGELLQDSRTKVERSGRSMKSSFVGLHLVTYGSPKFGVKLEIALSSVHE